MSHKFAYKWSLTDGYPASNIKPNGLTVFGTFICGGGSTMGYKLAGFEHLGGVEIDKKVSKVYQANHNPKYFYNEDIREFRQRTDLPQELFELDILDGSPPCSSFSTSGNREKDWNKKKVFREGQARQVLDDLFFEYIALAKRLQPKVVIAENVKGLILGNARAYVKKIYEAFIKAGYQVQLFLLNAASMGVPQKRERVFFIARRNDLPFSKLKLEFTEPPIYLDKINPILKNKFIISSGNERHCKFGRLAMPLGANTPSFTLIATPNQVDYCDGVRNNEFIKPMKFTNKEATQISSFPSDYNFKDLQPKYLIGMSVPPIMMAQIAQQIYLQWFD